jgi:predicted phage terminase large subunit-like protein
MQEQRDRLKGVLFDRRKRGGVIKAILTRWGEADLLPTFKELGFKIIEQPITGRYPWGGGRLLCPELFPDSRIQIIKVKKGGPLFQMTYMGDPSAATGSMIKREWWRFYDPNTVPEFKYTIHSWDLSIGRKGGDYSAFGSWGLAKDGYYMTNGGRWILTPGERLNKMKLLYEAERPRFVLIEDSSVSMDFIEMMQRETRLPLKPVSPGTMDKEARVKARVNMIEAGRVWLPNNQPWVDEFIDECAAFPGGQYDDQVDQMSQALKYLEGKGSGRISSGGKMVHD